MRRPAFALERPQFAAQLRDRLVDVVEFGAGRVAEHLTVELSQLLLRQTQVG